MYSLFTIILKNKAIKQFKFQKSPLHNKKIMRKCENLKTSILHISQFSVDNFTEKNCLKRSVC